MYYSAQTRFGSTIDWPRPYVDNGKFVDRTRAVTALALAALVRELDRCNLVHRVESEPSRQLDSVGTVLCFRSFRVYNRPARAWRFRFATLQLARQHRASGEVVQVWVGHAVHLFGMAPTALSIFSAVYRFVAEHGPRVADFPRAVLGEFRVAAALCLFAASSLDREVCTTAFMYDSSLKGYAVLSARLTPQEVLTAGIELRERWRFKPNVPDFVIDTFDGQSASEASRFSPFDAWADTFRTRPKGNRSLPPRGLAADECFVPVCDRVLAVDVAPPADDTSIEGWYSGRFGTSELAASDVDFEALAATACREHRAREGAGSTVVSNGVDATDDPDSSQTPPFPSVRSDILCPSRWRRVLVGAWNDEAHIALKEARTSLFALRRVVPAAPVRGLHVLGLGDNLGAICAFERGRSPDYAVNALCRQACGLCFGRDVVYHQRHVISEDNAADSDSRLADAGLLRPGECLFGDRVEARI